MTAVFGNDHGFPWMMSTGLRGVPDGSYVFLDFAVVDVRFNKMRDIHAVLCTAQGTQAARHQKDLPANAVVSVCVAALPGSLFRFLRAQDCKLNRSTPDWKLTSTRSTLVVHISELAHVLKSRQRCTRHWFESHPHFSTLDGFKSTPVDPSVYTVYALTNPVSSSSSTLIVVLHVRTSSTTGSFYGNFHVEVWHCLCLIARIVL